MRKREARYPSIQATDRGLHRVLIDLDGTLAQDTWPQVRVGEPIPEGVEILKHYAKQGFEVCIYTARPRSHWSVIHKWLCLHGLDEMVYDVICEKPTGWLFIDDRAWNPWR